MAEFRIPELNAPFTFSTRPESIPGDFRPLWRIGLVILILRLSSRGSKSSFGRLHVLNWAIRTEQNREELERVILGEISPDAILVRIEPSLNRAVDFAQGQGLLECISGDKIRLTKLGLKQADEIIKPEDVFVVEKEFLKQLGKGLTEQLVNTLFSKTY